MICKNCHEEINENAAFCPKCGATQNEGTSQQAGSAQASNQGQPNNNAQSQPNNAQGQNYYNNQNGAYQNNQYNYSPNQGQTNQAVFAFAYVPFLFWLPLACDKNKTHHGRECANQGLLLLIFSFAVNLIIGIIRAIVKSFSYSVYSYSLYGSIYSILSIISTIVSLAVLACVIAGIIFEYSNKHFKIPLIGSISIIK